MEGCVLDAHGCMLEPLEPLEGDGAAVQELGNCGPDANPGDKWTIRSTTEGTAATGRNNACSSEVSRRARFLADQLAAVGQQMQLCNCVCDPLPCPGPSRDNLAVEPQSSNKTREKAERSSREAHTLSLVIPRPWHDKAPRRRDLDWLKIARGGETQTAASAWCVACPSLSHHGGHCNLPRYGWRHRPAALFVSREG